MKWKEVTLILNFDPLVDNSGHVSGKTPIGRLKGKGGLFGEKGDI